MYLFPRKDTQNEFFLGKLNKTEKNKILAFKENMNRK